MKKALLLMLVVVLLSVPIYGFAQSYPAREASGLEVGRAQSRFTNISVMGLEKVGNPGFIALKQVVVDATSYQPTYYLWVDAEGDLVMASGITIENCSEFPDGDFNTDCILNKDVKVGGQT